MRQMDGNYARKSLRKTSQVFWMAPRGMWRLTMVFAILVNSSGIYGGGNW
jgi:hypothetical protein